MTLAFGVLLLLAPLWAVASLHRHMVVRRRDLADATGCARCGYPTAGLETLRCPECGADLLKEGILTPPLLVRHRRSKSIAILTACTLTLALSGFLGLVLGAMAAAAGGPVMIIVVGLAFVILSTGLAILVTLRSMKRVDSFATRTDPGTRSGSAGTPPPPDPETP